MKVCIEADGGSRGNPGIAGSGTVVYAADHREILRRVSYVVGTATNNVAEYQGLINGLRAAAELGADEVAVYMDSKLVVEQMSGRWKIKHPDMKKLALEARDLAATFTKVTYEWVPRAKNGLADELANKAMDAMTKGAKVGLLGAEPEVPKIAVDTNSPARWNGATTAPTRLILLRHGQTPMSAARMYSGRSNPDLSELGEQQAQDAAAALAGRGGIDLILASPLRRAQQTAATAAELTGLDVVTHEGLIEMDFGEWDGLTFDEARARNPELHEKWINDPSVTTPDGESLQKLHRRVKKLREELQRDYEGKNILVVSHLTVIKSLLRQGLDAGPQIFKRIFLDLASISIVEFYPDDKSSVRLVNDTSHLR
ncbi:bifunctional RNase H/acid phosphatase [Corynebacterium sp. A21]|uniref:bifunctional RNase H/acid phosphatase n=1 Tax=Corynebacterium sp. A21 TaxID=3457318 RepID=UPI003FD0D82F